MTLALRKLISKAYDLAAENLDGGDFEDYEELEKQAKAEANGLILALAKTSPYTRFGGGAQVKCLHCDRNYDPNSNPLSHRAHHEDSCVWLICRELAYYVTEKR